MEKWFVSFKESNFEWTTIGHCLTDAETISIFVCVSVASVSVADIGSLNNYFLFESAPMKISCSTECVGWLEVLKLRLKTTSIGLHWRSGSISIISIFRFIFRATLHSSVPYSVRMGKRDCSISFFLFKFLNGECKLIKRSHLQLMEKPKKRLEGGIFCH